MEEGAMLRKFMRGGGARVAVKGRFAKVNPSVKKKKKHGSSWEGEASKTKMATKNERDQ